MQIHILRLIFLFCIGGPSCFAFPAVPDVNGMKFIKVRASIIKAGWKPRETHLFFGEVPERKHANAAIFFKAGFREVEICSGTGVNPCIFNYYHGGDCLRIYTIGEQPKLSVVKKFTYECPEDEALLQSTPANVYQFTRPSH